MNDSTDQLTLEGAQQDWAVVVNPYANRHQRLVCMHRLGAVDVQTGLRIITPMIYTAIDAMTDAALLENVVELMNEATAAVVADLERIMNDG